MADMEVALRARLIAAATAAGSRVTVDERPQGSALPATVIETISDPRPQHLKGYDNFRETRVQLSCWAANPGAAKALAKASIAAVSEPVPAGIEGVKFGRTRAEGPRPLNESVNGTLLFRRVVDLFVWHNGD